MPPIKIEVRHTKKSLSMIKPKELKVEASVPAAKPSFGKRKRAASLGGASNSVIVADERKPSKPRRYSEGAGVG